MKRWSAVAREQLTGEGLAVWDRIMASRGRVPGLFQALIQAQVPALADRIAHLGAYVRFEGLLAGAERELAVLVVARELGCRVEWGAHEASAGKEGVSREAIERVLGLGDSAGLPERERLVVDLVRSLLREHRIPDDLFAGAQAQLGQPQLAELIGLCGHYAMICLLLNAFEMEPASGERPF